MMRTQVSKEQLLAAWREAVRAAEMAERVATAAAEAASQADVRAEVSSELADLAERAAESAARAAQRARAVATEAAAAAQGFKEMGGASAQTLNDARAAEKKARDAYHDHHNGEEVADSQPAQRA
jgi:hypothetical protein